MPNSEILKRVQNLHNDLACINDHSNGAEAVDKQTVEALGELVKEVNSLVDRKSDKAATDISHEEHHEFLDRIRQFDAEHPTVARFLSQLTDVLAMMGI